MPEDYEQWDLGDWIDFYLIQQQRSGSWLARQIGRDPATITRWRMGESKPQRPEDVVQIATVLGITDPDVRATFFRSVFGSYVFSTGVLHEDLEQVASTSFYSAPLVEPDIPVPSSPVEVAEEVVTTENSFKGVFVFGAFVLFIALLATYLFTSIKPVYPDKQTVLAVPQTFSEVAPWVLSVAHSKADVLLAKQQLYDAYYLVDPSDWNTEYDVTGDSVPDWLLSIVDPAVSPCGMFLVVDPSTGRLLYMSQNIMPEPMSLYDLQVLDVNGDTLMDILPILQSCRTPDEPKELSILTYINPQLQAPTDVGGLDAWMVFYQDTYSLKVVKQVEGGTVLEVKLPYQVHPRHGPLLPSISTFVFKDHVYTGEGTSVIPLNTSSFQTSSQREDLPVSSIGYVQLIRANTLMEMGQYEAANVMYRFLFRGMDDEGNPLVATGWKHDPAQEIRAIRQYAGVRYILSAYLLAPQPDLIDGGYLLDEVATEFPDSPYSSPLQAMVTAFNQGERASEACLAFLSAITQVNITYPLTDMGKNVPLSSDRLCPY